MKIVRLLFLQGLFWGIFCTAPLHASSHEWHVVKENISSQETPLISITLEKLDKTDASERAHIEALLFSDTDFRLQLIDSPARSKKLSQVMESSSFLAGVNGGYFHPDGTPLGLAISQGNILHRQETAQLLSGLIIATQDHLFLLRVGEKRPAKIEEALQTGPFLVDHGVSVPGLETRRISRRTFLATDNHGSWVMGVTSPLTLAETSQALLTAAPLFFKKTKIERALNLDGGSSSGLWVKLVPTPFSQEELGYVRNFLGLAPKKNTSTK